MKPSATVMIKASQLSKLRQRLADAEAKVKVAEGFGMRFGILKDGQNPEGRMTFDMARDEGTEFERLFEAFTDGIFAESRIEGWMKLCDDLMKGAISRAKLRPRYEALKAKFTTEQRQEKRKIRRGKSSGETIGWTHVIDVYKQDPEMVFDPEYGWLHVSVQDSIRLMEAKLEDESI